nr:hypothetical protein [Tanacetum cinerariifolium]
MNPIETQQAALDNALVPSKKRLKIESRNARIAFTRLQKEETYQVTLEALKLSHCYLAFQIIAKVLEIYMDQRVFNHTYHGIGLLWCIFGKSTGLDRLRKSRAQILWAMYNQKNVYYVALLWEDFMYQADNREISSARKERMPYPRFTKVIIDHFISKDNTISMRNMINLYTLSKAYKTYLDYATRKVTPKKARKFKKLASPKLKTILAYPKELTQKGKRVKRAAKRPLLPQQPVLSSKILLISLHQRIKHQLRLEKQARNPQASGYGSSRGDDFESEVPDEHADKTKDTSDSEDESDDVYDEDDNDDEDGNDDESGNDDDDGGNDAQDSKQTDSYDDENPSFTVEDYEEEQDEENVLTPDVTPLNWVAAEYWVRACYFIDQ